ncbi:hypothetical protein DF042_27130 [Burkholderia cenocepacia]|nr:hypothetical protein DF042_27130 [Burkholderia cenocepacia]
MMSKTQYLASPRALFAARAVVAAILSIASVAGAQSLPQLPAPAAGVSAPAAAGTAPAARGVQMPAAAGSAVVAPTADVQSATLIAQLQHPARVQPQKHKARKVMVKAKPGPNGTYTPKDAPNDTSLVSYDFDPDYTFPIKTVRDRQTHIEFAPDEKILGVYQNEKGRWITTVSEVTSRDLFFAPREAGLSTPTTIITSKRKYHLLLTSAAPDAGDFYARVNWYYPDMLPNGMQSTAGGYEYVGRTSTQHTDLGGYDDGYGNDGSANESGSGRPGTAIDLTRANFGWKVDGSASFAPTMVFDDGRAVYMQFGDHTRLPAIFVLNKAGKGDVASFVTVPDSPSFVKVTEYPEYGLLLVRDGEEMKIFNPRGGGCGLFGCRSSNASNLYGRNGS